MPFIGQQPITGAYSKLDSITTSATATYNLQLNGGAYYPQSANHLLVSLNGVMQAPQDSFTVSGSQITFASALTSSDSIDFIMALGDVLDIGTPSDGSVNTSQLANSAVTDAKIVGMSASKLTGALPAIDGSALTGINSSDILNVYSNKILTDLEVGDGSRHTWPEAEITVTPTSTSSSFLLQLDAPAWSTNSSTYGNLGFYKTIGATTTEIPTGTWVARLYLLAGGESRNVYHHVNAQFWDSPATTSSVTYKIYLERAGGSDSVAIGGQNTSIPSNFTIYELSGATLLTDGV